MKKFIFGILVVAVAFVACKSDDGGDTDDGCKTCAEYEITTGGQTQTFPELEVCELANGNAEVMAQDTGIGYQEYIDTLEIFTVCN
jgi:hypothetical protein